jgi:hypothetical protein
MRLEILKIVGSVIGAIISLKIIFWLFSPSEIWAIVLIFAFIFFAYGIQTTEWTENESFSIFGLNIYNSSKVHQQYRVFGIIPISKTKLLESHHSILEDLDPPVLIPTKTAISMLPFGALVSKVGK